MANIFKMAQQKPCNKWSYTSTDITNTFQYDNDTYHKQDTPTIPCEWHMCGNALGDLPSETDNIILSDGVRNQLNAWKRTETVQAVNVYEGQCLC